MTLERLKEKMLYQLQGFKQSPERENITTETPHSDVLSDDDGPPSSASIYKDLVKFSVKLEGAKLKRWPKKWIGDGIDDLAPKLHKD